MLELAAFTKSRSMVSNSVFHLSCEGVDINQRPRVARNHDGVAPKLLHRARFQTGLRQPVTRTRAPPSRSIFAVASPGILVPPIVTAFLSWYRSLCILLVTPPPPQMAFLRFFAVVPSWGSPPPPPGENLLPPPPHRVARRPSAPPGPSPELRAHGCCAETSRCPRPCSDGLPRGFLAGAVVEVWLALHLHWA